MLCVAKATGQEMHALILSHAQVCFVYMIFCPAQLKYGNGRQTCPEACKDNFGDNSFINGAVNASIFSKIAAMKLHSLLTALLIPIHTTFAARKSPSAGVDRFLEYNAKQLSAGGPLRLNDASYDALIKTPRDYSVAVLLTALEARFGCNLCNEFQPEWEMLGKQWAKGDREGEGRLLFGTLDFADGRQTFQSVCNNHLSCGKTLRENGRERKLICFAR